MIPTTNQFPMSNESQSMQVPKIDHILAHASNPELSYIYARPELQATASVNSQDATSLIRGDSQTPKKGRPAKGSKGLDTADKKAGIKPRKPDPYDKYYLDNTKPAKKPPPKKVDLWSQEAWDDILNRKRKYFEFLKLTGELNDERSDDEGRDEEFEFKHEEGEYNEEHHQQHYGEYHQYHEHYEGNEEQEQEGHENYEEQGSEIQQEDEENNAHAHHENENEGVHEEEEENKSAVDSQNRIEIEVEGGHVEEEEGVSQQREAEGEGVQGHSDQMEMSEGGSHNE